MTSRPCNLVLALLACALAWNTPAAAQCVADGTPVSTGSRGKLAPSMVPDGSGGMFAVWEDYRGGTGRIYAQRLNAPGVPQWTANGIAFDLSRPYGQTGPVAVPDKVGGVIAAWIEYAGLNEVICAQRFDASGSFLWSSIFCRAPGVRRYMPIVSDGSNPITIGSAGGGSALGADGRRARTLLRSEEYDAGSHALAWDGNDVAGHRVASGVYLMRATAGPVSGVRRVLVSR